MMTYFLSYFFVGCVLWMVALTGCRTREEAVTNPDEVVTSEMETPVMEQYRGNELRWKMWGIRAEVAATGKIRVQTPRVLVYEKGAPTLTLTAEQGEIDQRTRNFRVYGDVKGIALEAKLFTDELRWTERDGTLTAPNEARIVRGSSVMNGRHLVSYPNLQKMSMETVRGRLHPKDEKIEKYELPALDK